MRAFNYSRTAEFGSYIAPRDAMKEARKLRIDVASRGDVQAERDLLPGIIDELNRGMAPDRGLRLDLSRWETDAYPGFRIKGYRD